MNCHSPGDHATAMAIYVLVTVLSSDADIEVLLQQPEGDTIVANTIRCLKFATAEDDEPLHVLQSLLEHAVARKYVLVGDHR